MKPTIIHLSPIEQRQVAIGTWIVRGCVVFLIGLAVLLMLSGG